MLFITGGAIFLLPLLGLNSLIYTDIASDTWSFFWPSLSVLSNYIQNVSLLPQWSNSLGIGGSLYSGLALTPISYLVSLIAKSPLQIPYLIIMINIIQLILAGFFFAKYLRLINISDKPYFLSIHNGRKIKIFPLKFNTKTTIEKYINPYYLSEGVNILTLFDAENNPIAERLYFNYDKIKTIELSNSSIKKLKDSTLISLSFNDIISEKFNNVSISVLPRKTKSYQHHHNILSSYYLKPYLKGTIENGKHYFSNVNNEVKKYNEWIVSGSYQSLLKDTIWQEATTIIWLDYSLNLIIRRYFIRTYKRVFLKEKCCGENYETLGRTFSKESLFLWIFKTYWQRKRRLKNWKNVVFSHKDWIILQSPKEENRLINLLLK